MKNLIIVLGNLGSGGLERITARIANWYANKGTNVTIVCLLSIDEKVFVNLVEGVHVIFYKNKQELSRVQKLFNSRKWIAFLKDIFAEKKDAVVLAMTLKIAALCSIANKKSKHRIVMREISDPRSKERSRFTDFFLHIFIKNIDSIIFQTNWEKKCYPSYLQKRGYVVQNPSNVSVRCDSIRNKTIVTMGRLNNSQKRHDVLLKAFSIFLIDHDNYYLNIYGDGPDYYKDIELAKKLGCLSRVEFINAKKDVHSLIKNSSMFIMTSDYEGMSNALIEAGLIGIPCITSNWPGVEDFIKSNENGLIYRRQKVNELVSCMNRLADDSSFANTLSTNFMKLKDFFDEKNVMPLYEKAIEGNCYEKI